MFANFFGIVIVSASALLIAALVLRPTPDLPASMNLGIVKAQSEATQQANTVGTATTTATNSESSSTEAMPTDSASEATTTTSTASNTTSEVTSAATNSSETSGNLVNTAGQAIKDATEAAAPQAKEMTALEKRNLEIRRRAAEQSASGTVRVNKSDIGRLKNQ